MNKRFLEILESIAFAKQALKSNLMRTTLSLLGVTVGIFCIIAALALVDSIEKSFDESFSALSDDLIFVQKMPMGPEKDGEYKWWDYMKRRNISLKDFKALSKRISSAEAIVFQAASIKPVNYRNSTHQNAQVLGVTSQYNKALEVKMVYGRFATELELSTGKNVAVIGWDIAEAIFDEVKNAVGEKIKIGGIKIKVIGVFEKEGNTLLPGGFDVAVVTPVSYVTKVFDVSKAETSMIVKAKEGVSVDELKSEVISLLRPIRKLKPTKKDDFAIIEASMISDVLDSVFGVLNLVGIGIGICALFVGGFGIMNIMFVSVKERTRQIGIQKALGAKNRFILLQFLFESVFLCIIGAVLGILLVFLIIGIVNSFSEFKFSLSMSNVMIGIITATILGVLAGIIPSYNASIMRPVDAIRSN